MTEHSRWNPAGRPGWMTAVMVMCLLLAVSSLWDLLATPVENAQEVWLCYMLVGMPARLTAPLHILIYVAGTYGLFAMRPWMWPWASVYAASVAIGMPVWGILYDARGFQSTAIYWSLSITTAALFAVLTVALWRSKARFVSA